MRVHAISRNHGMVNCISHGGCRRLIVGYVLKLMYLTRKYNQHFGSRGGKKKHDKWTIVIDPESIIVTYGCVEVPCGWCRLIVVWYSRGITIIEDAKNVGDGLCSEIASRETENRDNSASVVTDNHPVGSRCLARRSVAGMHFENAKTPVGLKTRVRTKIWTEIRRAAHVLTMRVHEKISYACCSCCSCFYCDFHGGWRRLIVGYELRLRYLMKHLGKIEFWGNSMGKRNNAKNGSKLGRKLFSME